MNKRRKKPAIQKKDCHFRKKKGKFCYGISYLECCRCLESMVEEFIDMVLAQGIPLSNWYNPIGDSIVHPHGARPTRPNEDNKYDKKMQKK